MFLCTGWPTVQLSRHSVSNEAARLVASNNYKNNRRNLLAVMAEVYSMARDVHRSRDFKVRDRDETETSKNVSRPRCSSPRLHPWSWPSLKSTRC